MDERTIEIGRSLLDALTAALCFYNARRFGGLQRVNLALFGAVMLTLAAGLVVEAPPFIMPLEHFITDFLRVTFVAALCVVQVLLALNGRLQPFKRRKDDLK